MQKDRVMLRFAILVTIFLLSFKAYADEQFDKIFNATIHDDLYIHSVICRGGSDFWHMIAIERLNGKSKEQIIKMQTQPDERLPQYLNYFYSIPINEVFDYLVTQHGQCIHNLLGISQDKASMCFKKYLQPKLFKLYGPYPEGHKSPPTQDAKWLIYSDHDYLECLRSSG